MADKTARQLINWNAGVRIDGKETTLHDWLEQNYRTMSDSDVARILAKNGIAASRNAVRHHRRNHGWSKESGQAYVLPIDTTVIDEEVEESASEAEALLLKAIKNAPRSISELSEMLDRSESSISEMLEALRDKSYNIVEAGEKHRLDTTSITTPPPLPQTLADQVGHYVRFGVASDLHSGSTAQQITNLQRFIHDAYGQGIRHILVPGDLTAGLGVYRGQINDLYATSADAQLVALDWLLPKLDDLVYYVIGGNHDYSFVKASGYNIVAAFAAMREDVVYLGFDMADVPITDQVDVRLWHPSGGVPYAVSYRLQKGMQQMAYAALAKAIESGENPRMRVVLSGHLHVSMTMQRGPIMGLQCGCFEGTTNYLKRKALFPQVGGYIIELWLTDGGLIQRVRHEWVPYLEIENDYLNYPELIELLHGSGSRADEVVPLFMWQDEDG